ncbi:MAG: DUF1559 domain-containing protein [Pirellulales bacterium]
MGGSSPSASTAPAWHGSAHRRSSGADRTTCHCHPNNGFATTGWHAARSHHPCGVNLARADRSVSFVSTDIDVFVWRALATRAGGEAYPPPHAPKSGSSTAPAAIPCPRRVATFTTSSKSKKSR